MIGIWGVAPPLREKKEPEGMKEYRFDFSKEYSVEGGANHWPMALRVNRIDLDGNEFNISGWEKAQFVFANEDVIVTINAIEESASYFRFTWFEFVGALDSRQSGEITITRIES